ncbi:Aste57867_25201 [Aphanomyces stellatus]|uniref:Aste57867_25201 protein n=1 Tax=Aphanomyces stellatus TaxID=120398 RepID=A0A485LX28_9STRA|nr:hypothetical protein As57867_025123 [Aphanomyces stellatus]VFU01828.1 Aste57867_25201 [Aphanomyces stellatus]
MLLGEENLGRRGQGGVVDLLQDLRTKQVGARGSIRDLHREFDILLFTHAATTSVDIDYDTAHDHVIREYGSLGYYLRQHNTLLQVADGIDVIVDHYMQGMLMDEDSLNARKYPGDAAAPFDIVSVLRLLLALSGGSSGRAFGETYLGPSTLHLLRTNHPELEYNRRLGEGVVQSNVELANQPQALFHMRAPLSHADVKELLDAMAAIPGHSAMQRDLWHEKDSERPVDLFGALHHSSFHRQDNQLVRFDLRLSLPHMFDSPPDLITNALEAKKNPPRRQRLRDEQSHATSNKPHALPTNASDCDLLFTSHKSTIEIDRPLVAKVVRTDATAVRTSPPLRVWENLGPNKVPWTPPLMLGKEPATRFARPCTTSPMAATSEPLVVAAVLKVLQGLESTIFPRDALATKFTVTHTTLATGFSNDITQFLETFARLGTQVIRLATLSAHFGQHVLRGGRVLQSLGAALHYLVAGHQAFVLELKADTLVGLWAATSTPRSRLDALASLFLCDDDALWGHPDSLLLRLPRGLTMIDHVYKALLRFQCTDPSVASLVIWLFAQMATPYFQALSQWIYLGEFDDPHGEFSVENRFCVLECMTQNSHLTDAIGETGLLLQITRDVHSHVYALTSHMWSPLLLMTDHAELQHYLDKHAKDLEASRTALQAFNDEQLQKLADSIFALKREKPAAREIHRHDDAQRQLKRYQQHLQRKLLDEQMAERRDAQQHEAAQELLEREADAQTDFKAKLKLEHDRARLIEIYEGLMAEAERKHRKALWRQARVTRKETFQNAVTKLYRRESTAWCNECGIDIKIHPHLDPTRKPSLLVHVGATPPDENEPHAAIRVLQAPGGASDGSAIYLGGAHVDQEHSAIRVLQEPGGGGLDAAMSIYHNQDCGPSQQNSAVRVLNVPGGGGSDAADVLYHGDTVDAEDYRVNAVRVTHEPGGSGAAAVNAIYHGEMEATDTPFGHFRVQQEPGGGGQDAASAIYNQTNHEDHDMGRSVRILQEPGGSGRAAASIIYDGDVVDIENKMNHIRVLQPPGGNGNDVGDLLYGGMTPDNQPPRASVRVTQAPGGNGDELSDTLYAQFSNLSVGKSSVRILAPAGGGRDSVSALVFGFKEGTKQPLQHDKSNIQIEWAVHSNSRMATYKTLPSSLFDPAPLTTDFTRALETYRALMQTETPTEEYAPIDTLIRFSLSQPILDQRAFVGATALALLREHEHLMLHMTALHDLMLLSGGVWVERFMQEFTAGLETFSRVNWGVPGALNDLLAFALDEAKYKTTDATARFAFRPTDGLEQLLGNRTMEPLLEDVLASIEPVYALPDVLESHIVPRETMVMYKRLHMYLFQVRAIALSIQRMRRILRTHARTSTACHILVHVQQHLCSSVVAHCFQSIADEWHRFQDNATRCRDAIEFKHLHNRYVAAVAARCFLDPSTDEVHRAIQACLGRAMNTVDVIQNNATNPIALDRVLAHLMTESAAAHARDMASLCHVLRHDPSDAAAELCLRIDLSDYYGAQAV